MTTSATIGIYTSRLNDALSVVESIPPDIVNESVQLP